MSSSLIQPEHRLWLESQPAGLSRRTLASGIRREFKLSAEEAREIVRAFLEPGEDIGPEEVIRILQQESNLRRRMDRLIRGVALAGIIFILTLSLVIYIRKGTTEEMGSLGALVALAGVGAAASSRHKLAAKAAARLQDKRALGPLVEMLDSQDKMMRRVAEEAVASLLPRIDQEDYDSLDRVQTEKLFSALKTTADLDFTAAVLGAAKRYGGRESIAPLEQFAAGRSPMKKKEHERAVSLSKMALADIRMRIARQKIDTKLEEIGGTVDVYAKKVLGQDDANQTLNA